jgi:ABC-2 type transport system permease protein
MKIINIISKCLKEQLRSYWLFLLSLSMGPFFVFIYFLIIETSQPSYSVLFTNNDKGLLVKNQTTNYGDSLATFIKTSCTTKSTIPVTLKKVTCKADGLERIKYKKADALIVVNDSFSQSILRRKMMDSNAVPKVEFYGDLTNTNYMISAVWANGIIDEYALQETHNKRVVEVKETALGSSAAVNSFDMIVPGILLVSLIMLMYTASIAFVSEVENKTIIRLKLSKLKAFEFLAGISIVQLLVGIVAVLLSLLTAILLGFHYSGSVFAIIIFAVLTSLSIIAFSLIIAAVTKSATEVLVVGNFPMFLFMFFTGVAFPLKNNALFTIAGYPINIQGLMTPTHAVSAMNKILIMKMDISDVLPEIISIIVLTLVYFIIGGLLFKKRHLGLT